MDNQNQILVKKLKDDKGQEIYSFYILKTVSETEARGLNS
jgi:hypothetical protein